MSCDGVQCCVLLSDEHLKHRYRFRMFVLNEQLNVKLGFD